MAYKFTYTGAPLLFEEESVIPFKTGLHDYEGQQLECKTYRYKVASDIAVEVFIPKDHQTAAYTRGLLLDENGDVVATGSGCAHFQKAWVRDYLKTFNKRNKPGLAWIEDFRREIRQDAAKSKVKQGE